VLNPAAAFSYTKKTPRMLAGGINVIDTPQRFHANLPKASTKAKQSKNTLKRDVLKHSIFVVLFYKNIHQKQKNIWLIKSIYQKKVRYIIAKTSNDLFVKVLSKTIW